MPIVAATPHALTDAASNAAGVYAQRITAALPRMAARRVSLHDSRGRVHWQSTEVWSAEEHEAVRLAIEQFSGPSAPLRTSLELPGQRVALLLRASCQFNRFRGFAMIVVDQRQLRGLGASLRDLPVPVQRAVQDWAMALVDAPDPVPSSVDTREPAMPERDLTPVQTHELLSASPAVDDAEVDEYFRRLREIPLSLVAQALVPIQDGARIKRYEVLLRDAGETGRDAAPLELLRDADRRGLGDVLDRRAAGALLVWLSTQRELFVDEPSQFSLNLSSTTLADPNFVRFIELCIAKSGIPPQLLSFELDESLWRNARRRVELFAQALHTLGTGLVIDNCTLQEWTPELMGLQSVGLVKIDRRLTSGLAASRIAQMRIGALVQMGRIAGVHTVAKCVDDAEERHQLQALGVDFVQGHATASPTTLAELAAQRAGSVLRDPGIPEALLRS